MSEFGERTPLKPLWVDLDKHIQELQLKTRNRKLWEDIKQSPLTPQSIDKLIAEKWKFKTVNIPDYGICSIEAKFIQLGTFNHGFVRDIYLLHELYHAWYGQQTNDGTFSESPYKHDNRLIGHWLARKWRTNPEILKSAVLSFGLPPRIYDASSYNAFSSEPNDFNLQLCFDFGKTQKSGLSQIMMD